MLSSQSGSSTPTQYHVIEAASRTRRPPREVAELHTSIAVRDSKDPNGSTLRFTRGAWTGFVRSIR
ncbi:DUF397 domain-containing protein [Micromonospora parva]|uniref:DUF397 domain-containing protein n=1 Tax=Micromonospora parva TaxID=1464048 RepID=UPI0033CBFF8B